MLRFTGAGVVSTPTTLQIRITRQFPGRVQAGAPIPQRSLSPSEVRENLAHFTLGKQGPRSTACTSLVLSGIDLAKREELASLLFESRKWGIDRVTLHLGPGDTDTFLGSSLADQVDALALQVSASSHLEELVKLREQTAQYSWFVTAVVLLRETDPSGLMALARGLAEAGPNRVVFTWPLTGEPPPPAESASQMVREPLELLRSLGVPAGVKGLPICLLQGQEERLWRSGNRWYVDAEHQLGQALLFFPDVVRFAKEDVCRFCRYVTQCDGVPDRWLRQGLAGNFSPIRP